MRRPIAILLLVTAAGACSPGVDDTAPPATTTTIGYWYTDWECEAGFVVEYLTTNDPDINAESPAYLCDEVLDFGVTYLEFPGALERLSDGRVLTLIEEYVDGRIVASYAVQGESESPIRCDDPWPLHERDMHEDALADHRIVTDLIVSVERQCPSEEWKHVVRLDGSG